MSSQESHHPSSVKYHDLRLLTQISSATPLPPSIDPSGPLTPDTVVLVNPFASLASSHPPATRSLRLIGDYELSETKFDDFKCARHIPTGDALLYKEHPLSLVRQRLEPYQRLSSLLLASHSNKQLTSSMSICQLAAKYHLHFFHDILTLDDDTAVVLYPNYASNLHTHITDKHRLTEPDARHLFSQIVGAIQMCHRVGLIMRDLKLRKIIFPNQSHAQLLLTGLDEAIMLANPIATDDLVSSRFSCPVYACPEIVLNRQMYSGKMADSWSLGIILYTMLFGRYPFCDRTLVGLFIKIGRCRPDIPRSISVKARSLLRSLIRVRPNERLSAHDILGHVWFNGERDLTTTTPSIVTSVTGSDDHPTSIQHNSNDKSVIDDAVVPNFACE